MTEQSETNLGELYAALAKAQGAMTAADKDHSVGFDTREDSRGGPQRVKYSYATLAGVWESCRKPLSDNGLAVVQQVTAATDKSITVRSILGHASGQSIPSELTMPVVGGTAQAVGSAITYARRFALMALVGIVADEDDDGNAASDQKASIQKKAAAPKPVEAAPAPVAHAVFTPTGTAVSVPGPVPLAADITPLNDWYIKDDARAAFWAAAKAAGYKTKEDTMAKMGIASMRLWPGTLAQAIDKLQPKKELAPFEGE
jgi:hypothetical protein